MAKEQSLNADDIAHDIHRDLHHLGINKGASEEIVRGVFSAIKQRLAAREQVSIRGFGVFEAKMFKGRTLNTPLVAGGSIDFPDALVLRFRQSAAAKREINEMAKQNGKAKAKKAPKEAAKEAPKKGKAKPAKAEPEEATEEATEEAPAKKGIKKAPAKKGAKKAKAKG